MGRSAGRKHPILLEKNYLRKVKGVFNTSVNAPFFSYSLFAFRSSALFFYFVLFVFVFYLFSTFYPQYVRAYWRIGSYASGSPMTYFVKKDI